MGRKAGISGRDVVEAAARLADEQGYDGVTLTTVAERLGVRPPSLYAHLNGLPGLRRELALVAASELARQLEEAVAGRRGLEALRELCVAYREYARARPGLYAAAQRAPAAGEDAELELALLRAVQPALRALAEAGVRSSELVHMARAVRAALHGFVTLEAASGFGLPEKVDESYERLIELLINGIGAARAGAASRERTED
jgi:AcrR family transcriptional regulator